MKVVFFGLAIIAFNLVLDGRWDGAERRARRSEAKGRPDWAAADRREGRFRKWMGIGLGVFIVILGTVRLIAS